MSSSVSECPKCRSRKYVRLLSDSGAYFRYACSNCRIDFKVPKRKLKDL